MANLEPKDQIFVNLREIAPRVRARAKARAWLGLGLRVLASGGAVSTLGRISCLLSVSV